MSTTHGKPSLRWKLQSCYVRMIKVVALYPNRIFSRPTLFLSLKRHTPCLYCLFCYSFYDGCECNKNENHILGFYTPASSLCLGQTSDCSPIVCSPEHDILMYIHNRQHFGNRCSVFHRVSQMQSCPCTLLMCIVTVIVMEPLHRCVRPQSSQV